MKSALDLMDDHAKALEARIAQLEAAVREVLVERYDSDGEYLSQAMNDLEKVLNTSETDVQSASTTMVMPVCKDCGETITAGMGWHQCTSDRGAKP
jgi:hypothetical protein